MAITQGNIFRVVTGRSGTRFLIGSKLHTQDQLAMHDSHASKKNNHKNRFHCWYHTMKDLLFSIHFPERRFMGVTRRCEVRERPGALKSVGSCQVAKYHGRIFPITWQVTHVSLHGQERKILKHLHESYHLLQYFLKQLQFYYHLIYYRRDFYFFNRNKSITVRKKNVLTNWNI